MAKTQSATKSLTKKPSSSHVSPPWERTGSEPRFKGHRVAFGGKLASLRKDEVVKVLEAEGATVANKLGPDTTVFVLSLIHI